jgi:hypothetical protein
VKHTLKGIASTREIYLDGVYLDPADSQKVWNHSPDGFNWGYGGSGPAQLALAIVLRLTGGYENYQDFKFKFVAGLPQGENFEVEFDPEDYGVPDPPLDRMEMAIISVLYEVYPQGLSQEEIMNRIFDKGLLDMTDEEFNQYRTELVISKRN